jgi:hypothetical protein
MGFRSQEIFTFLCGVLMTETLRLPKLRIVPVTELYIWLRGGELLVT